jgi:hypothetical protein
MDSKEFVVCKEFIVYKDSDIGFKDIANDII